jgi:hypothetical protein
MTFDDYIANAEAILDAFPNERVWSQGGIVPNRQIERPEAGYCIVFRYDEAITSPISCFMSRVRALLPPMVEYNESSLHTTIGVCGKGGMSGFVPDRANINTLRKSVEDGLRNSTGKLRINFGKWLFNHEALLVSGFPNRELWQLVQNVAYACYVNNHALEMSRILHVTTARFISNLDRQVFEEFLSLMKSAPDLESTRPASIDVATWCCDGLSFDLISHQRYPL